MDAGNRDYVSRQYSTDESLNIRIETHQRYGIGPADIFSRLTGIMWERRPQPGRILDVGAGTGNWYRAIRSELGRTPRYTGVDQSQGMVARLRGLMDGDSRAEAMLADAQSLPFKDNEFDWVGMHFMLYHVPDIRAAVAEGWRVLKPSGILTAATNGEHPYSALWDLAKESVRQSGLPGAAENLSDRFTLSNGAEFFPVVPTVFAWMNGFRFTSAEPALRYLASGPLRLHLGTAADDASTVEQVLELVRTRIGAILDAEGIFQVPSQSGFFLAQKS